MSIAVFLRYHSGLDPGGGRTNILHNRREPETIEQISRKEG